MMKLIKRLYTFLKTKLWYKLLVLFSSIYVFYYRYSIFSFKELNANNLIFVLWLILLLFPLFTEIEFFGLKLKKQFEKATDEVKEKINEIRIQLMELKISNSNIIYLDNKPLPPERLDSLNKNFRSDRDIALSTIRKTDSSEKDGSEEHLYRFDISDDTIYLFKVRLILENAINELCEKIEYTGPKTLFEMVRYLIRCEIFNGITGEIINQVIKIANRGVHGEIVSKEYITFVQKAFPDIQKILYKANNELHYCVCPRCKYSGYARYENVCPRCGFTSDEG